MDEHSRGYYHGHYGGQSVPTAAPTFRCHQADCPMRFSRVEDLMAHVPSHFQNPANPGPQYAHETSPPTRGYEDKFREPYRPSPYSDNIPPRIPDSRPSSHLDPSRPSPVWQDNRDYMDRSATEYYQSPGYGRYNERNYAAPVSYHGSAPGYDPSPWTTERRAPIEYDYGAKAPSYGRFEETGRYDRHEMAESYQRNNFRPDQYESREYYDSGRRDYPLRQSHPPSRSEPSVYDRKIHPSEQDAVDVLTRAYVPVDRNLAEEGPRSTMRKEPFANRTSRGESEYHTESDLLLDNSEEKKEDLYYRSLDDFVLYNSRGQPCDLFNTVEDPPVSAIGRVIRHSSYREIVSSVRLDRVVRFSVNYSRSFFKLPAVSVETTAASYLLLNPARSYTRIFNEFLDRLSMACTIFKVITKHHHESYENVLAELESNGFRENMLYQLGAFLVHQAAFLRSGKVANSPFLMKFQSNIGHKDFVSSGDPSSYASKHPRREYDGSSSDSTDTERPPKRSGIHVGPSTYDPAGHQEEPIRDERHSSDDVHHEPYRAFPSEGENVARKEENDDVVEISPIEHARLSWEVRRGFDDQKIAQLDPLPEPQVIVPSCPGDVLLNLFMMYEFINAFPTALHLKPISLESFANSVASSSSDFQNMFLAFLKMLLPLHETTSAPSAPITSDEVAKHRPLKELPLNEVTFPEIVRLYLIQWEYSERSLIDAWEALSFQAISVPGKLGAMSFFCDQILSETSLNREIDESFESYLEKKKELWKLNASQRRVQREREMIQMEIDRAAGEATSKENGGPEVLSHEENATEPFHTDNQTGSEDNSSVAAGEAEPKRRREDAKDSKFEPMEADEQATERNRLVNDRMQQIKQLQVEELRLKQEIDGSLDNSCKAQLDAQYRRVRIAPLGRTRADDILWLFPSVPGLYIQCSDNSGLKRYSTLGEFHELMRKLNVNGYRERQLLKNLEKHRTSIEANLSSGETVSFWQNPGIQLEQSLSDEQLGTLVSDWKKRFIDLVHKLLHAFGYVLNDAVIFKRLVKKNSVWRQALNERSKVDQLAEFVRVVYEALNQRNFCSLKSYEKSNWDLVLSSCVSFPQLFLQLMILESSINWSRSLDKLKCSACQKKMEADAVACVDCNEVFHVRCTDLRGRRQGSTDWRCTKCASEKGSSSESESSSSKESSVKESDEESDTCAVCGKHGELLICDSCSKVYHLGCLDPPLKRVPRGEWQCAQCVTNFLQGSQEKRRQVSEVSRKSGSTQQSPATPKEPQQGISGKKGSAGKRIPSRASAMSPALNSSPPVADARTLRSKRVPS